MASDVFSRVERLLIERGAAFEVLKHAPVFTSAEAAAIRGTPLSSGAKALLCKADDRWTLFVLPADRKLASKLARQALSAKGLRFADKDELVELTGLAPGAVPPFGSLFNLPTWCDEALANEPRINFNAGDHGISISMTFDDYARAERPTMGRFT